MIESGLGNMAACLAYSYMEIAPCAGHLAVFLSLPWIGELLHVLDPENNGIDR
jgi:hypothetical protein